MDRPTRYLSSIFFSHHSILPGPLTNVIKYFRFRVRFRRYVNFWVWKSWLPWVSDPREIYSPGYQTPRRLTPRSNRPKGDWLPRVSDSRKVDSPGYQTLERLTPRGIRLHRDWLPGVSDPGESYVCWFICTPQGSLMPWGVRFLNSPNS